MSERVGPRATLTNRSALHLPREVPCVCLELNMYDNLAVRACVHVISSSVQIHTVILQDSGPSYIALGTFYFMNLPTALRYKSVKED
jgi:hypothetical protein